MVEGVLSMSEVVTARRLNRKIAEISRSSEFFSVSELEAQTGQPKEKFAAVALKELVDNAIDAAEAASSNPEVAVEIDMGKASLIITVHDNGSGIESETVDKIKDFDIRVTDKLIYRSPSRGQQGNALKTILGMPYALGSNEPVKIKSRGIEHRIYASPNPLGEVKVAHDKYEIDGLNGTTIALTLPLNQAHFRFDANRWVRAYALANPHVLVKFRCFWDGSYLDNSDAEEAQEFADSYHPTVPDTWRKFMIKDLTAPAWYNKDTLERQIFTILKKDSDQTLREFVKSFRGLSANAKAKMVCNKLPDISHLRDFESKPEQISELLDAMNEIAEPPSPKVLGSIGKDHFLAKFSEWHGVVPDRFYYRRSEYVFEGIPFVIEAACSEVESECGELFHLLNFSPTFDDPLSNTRLAAGDVSSYGFYNFMRSCYVNPLGKDWAGIKQNVVVALHIVSPAFEFLDRGKTRVSLPAEVADEVANVLWAVGKSFYKEGKRRERDAVRQQKIEEERRRTKNDTEYDLKEAVFKVLKEVYLEVTAGERYPISVKDFHYAVRPKIQKYTKKTLKHSYFSQDVIIEYQRQYGKFKMLYYDPRGYLYEPHTGKKIPLGTREVDNYEFPSWLYNKILYVEKKGFVEPFLTAEIPERYDMALVAAEGYSSEAIRTLFQNADRETNYKIFVLHDCDPYGYNIARTLREETKRMPGYRVDVIDLGLNLDEALKMGLEIEEFSRKKALPASLKLTPLELEYFTGEEVVIGKVWKAKRIELNAMPPAKRIEFLERKLAEHGATAKVLPPDEVMASRIRTALDQKTRETARREIDNYLDIDSLIDQCLRSVGHIDLTDDIEEIKERLTTNPVELWSQLLDSRAAQQAEMLPWETIIAEACLENGLAV